MRATDIGPDVVQNLLRGHESEALPRIEAECRRAIDEDGADVIVIGSTTMHRAYGYLRERLPVPVINPGLVAHKMCKMVFELGSRTASARFPSRRAPDDALIFETLGRGTPGR